MTGEPLLHRLREDLHAQPHARARIKQECMQRINQPQAMTLLARLRTLLHPSDEQRLRVKTLMMMQLRPIPTRLSYRIPKWIAACTLVLIGLRASPLLFLAPHTIARSSVIILPTQGEVLLSMHGLWQPITEEIAITKGVHIRTGNGEATILLHDDGTVRLAPHTTVTLHDVTDRPDPGTGVPTLTLISGSIWLQGLLPKNVRGIEVVTQGGNVMLHRGSVAIMSKADDATDVRVWDRSVTILQQNGSIALLSGERMTLTHHGNTSNIDSIASTEYEENWVVQNLSRDAVHQREVAQMQQERRAARAGILPTSPLYSVKRAAEKMDILFTFDTHSRTQKQIDHASTRLNEAAALIAEGESGATVQLMEYREGLVAMASASGTDLARTMLNEALVSASAEFAVAMPADELYLLKRTVLEASVELSPDQFSAKDMESILLLDSLNSVRLSLQEDDIETMQRTFEAIRPSLALLELPEEEGGLTEDTRKEILSLLTDTAASLQEKQADADKKDDPLFTTLSDDLSPFLPPPPPPPRIVTLSPEQIDVLLAGILTRIEIYNLPRSRYNQLQYELDRIQGHPAEGSILRRLLRGLEPELAQYVKPAIEELREQMTEGQL